MNLAYVLLAISSFYLFSTIIAVVFQPYSRQAWRQIRKIQLLDLTEEAKEIEEQPLLYRMGRPIFELIKAQVKLTPAQTQNVSNKLEQAGYNYNSEQFIATKIMAGLGMLLLGILFTIIDQNPVTFAKWLLFAGIAFLLPDIILRGVIVKRREQIMEELPDFIDTTRSYLSAGLSIYQTIKHAQEIAGPGMAGLLTKLSAELEIYDQVTALRKFAQRSGLLEVQNFVVTIEQGIAAGIPLRDIFLSQSQLMRELRKMSLKRKIKQKPTYMALVGGLLFINIFIIIGLPALLTIVAIRGVGN